MKGELIKQIENYKPFNEQEEKDREMILDCLKNNEKIFSRQSKMAHMTASAWVVNKNRDKILMVYHNLYDSWSWLGGHADGEEDLLKVAMREVREESGLKNLAPISREIYSLEALTVDGHRKKGEYVSSHLHLNITYLLEADDRETLSIKPDENSGVAWFGLEKAVQSSSEKWFRDHIYSKLNEKLQKFPKLKEEEIISIIPRKDISGKQSLKTEEICDCKILTQEIEEEYEEEFLDIERKKNNEDNVLIPETGEKRESVAFIQEEYKMLKDRPVQEDHEESQENRKFSKDYIQLGNDRLMIRDIKSYGISTEQNKCYVKIYEQILDNHKLKKIFSSGYMWNGKKQKIDTSAEEYYDRAKKIARIYGYSVPTKTVLNKDGKIMIYCRRAGKLSLEEDFISCPVECLYIETENGEKKQFFEDKVNFNIYDKLKELDFIFSK